MLGGRHHAKVRLCCLSKAINLDLGESVLIIRVSAAARLLSLTAVNGAGGGRPAFSSSSKQSRYHLKRWFSVLAAC